jgi:hypothetical protein
MFNSITKIACLALVISVSLTGCKKEKNNDPGSGGNSSFMGLEATIDGQLLSIPKSGNSSFQSGGTGTSPTFYISNDTLEQFSFSFDFDTPPTGDYALPNDTLDIVFRKTLNFTNYYYLHGAATLHQISTDMSGSAIPSILINFSGDAINNSNDTVVIENGQFSF